MWLREKRWEVRGGWIREERCVWLREERWAMAWLEVGGLEKRGG